MIHYCVNPGTEAAISVERDVQFDVGALLHTKPWEKLYAISHFHADHITALAGLLTQSTYYEQKPIFLGPPGTRKKLQAAFDQFDWNLTTPDLNDYTIIEDEHPTYQTSNYSIQGVALDHGIPSIAYAYTVGPTTRINKEKLKASGLTPGPWLKELSQNRPLTKEHAELVEDVAQQTLLYATDFGFTFGNIEKLCSFEPDIFICEATYLHKDVELAHENKHLTAKQAGELAAGLNAKKLVLFHHSPRYKDRQAFLDEAATEFSGDIQ